MPLYDIEYVVPLSETQCEALAKAFTSLHSKRFNTPGVFVNVRFTDASTQKACSSPLLGVLLNVTGLPRGKVDAVQSRNSSNAGKREPFEAGIRRSCSRLDRSLG
jgi:hypothetical protein